MTNDCLRLVHVSPKGQPFIQRRAQPWKTPSTAPSHFGPKAQPFIQLRAQPWKTPSTAPSHFGPKGQPFIQRRAQPWYSGRTPIHFLYFDKFGPRANSSSSIPDVPFVNLDVVLLTQISAELLLKRHLPMVFSLAVDVSDHLLDQRLAHRKRAVAGLPMEIVSSLARVA